MNRLSAFSLAISLAAPAQAADGKGKAPPALAPIPALIGSKTQRITLAKEKYQGWGDIMSMFQLADPLIGQGFERQEPAAAAGVGEKVQAIGRLAEGMRDDLKAASEGGDPKSAGRSIEQKLSGERSNRSGDAVGPNRPGIAHPSGFFADAYGRAVAKAAALGIAKDRVSFNWIVHDRVANPDTRAWNAYFAFLGENKLATHLYIVAYSETADPAQAGAAISDNLPLARYLGHFDKGTGFFPRPFVAQYKVEDALVHKDPFPVSIPTHTDGPRFNSGVELDPDDALKRARAAGVKGELTSMYLDLVRDAKQDFWYHFLTADKNSDASRVFMVNARTGEGRWTGGGPGFFKKILAKFLPAQKKK